MNGYSQKQNRKKNGDLSRDRNVLLVERESVKKRKTLKSFEVMLLEKKNLTGFFVIERNTKLSAF